MMGPALTFAQQAEVAIADTTKVLPEVTITASRHKSDIATSPYSVEVLSRQKIEEFLYRSTPEALMAVPGVFVQKTNHGGGSAFVRGLTGNQTLTLIDGIRLNNSTFRYGPNQYLNTVDPFTISRIEVLKGSGSVQYGSDAMGGVVHIITQDPDYTSVSKFSGLAGGRYWSRDMEKTGRGQLVYSSPRLVALGGLSVKDYGSLFGGDTTGKQSPSGYGELDADMKLKWKLKEGMELIAAQQFVKQNNVPVFHKVKLENFALNEMQIQQRALSYLKFSIAGKNPFLQSISITPSFQQTAEVRRSQKNGNPSIRREEDGVSTVGALLDITSKFSQDWTSSSGLEYYYDDISSSKSDLNTSSGASVQSRGLYPDHSTYSNLSVFNIHQLRLKRFNLEAGLRYNWFEATIKDETLGTVKLSPAALVVNLGGNYKIASHNLHASFSSGYRAPNIDDMGTLGIVDFRYEIPSYSLKPERNYNMELGCRLKFNQWNASMTVFNNQLTDLIARTKVENEVISGYNVYKKENIEKAVIRGADLRLQWLPSKHWDLTAFTAYTFGKNLSKSEPLRRIPPLYGNTAIKYKLKKFYAAADLSIAARQSRLAQGDIDDNRIPAGGTPAWEVLNVFAGYQYNKLQIRLSAQNLFNEDYRTHGSGINGVGRSGLLSCTYNFN